MSILNNTKKKNGELIPSIMIFVSLALLFATRIDQSIITVTTYALVVFSFFCHWYIYNRLKQDVLYHKFVRQVLLLGCVYVFNMLIVHNLIFKEVLMGIIVTPSIALLIFRFRIKKIFSIGIFLSVLFFLVYKWFVLGYDANELTTNSRNYISYFLFLYLTPLVFTCYRNKELIQIIYPIIILVMSILAIGRGGILMSLLFLVGWIIMKTKTTRHKFLFYLTIFLLVILSSSVVISPDFLELYFSRFEDRALDSEVRTIGWINYINCVFDNPYSFFTGYPVHKEAYIMDVLDGSLHNSYLTLHARAGFVGIFIIFYILKGLIILFRNKEYLLWFFFASFLLKGISDADFPCLVVGGDIYIYMIILIYFESKQNKQYHYESKSCSALFTSVPPNSRK